jgi:hypothetical protein
MDKGILSITTYIYDRLFTLTFVCYIYCTCMILYYFKNLDFFLLSYKYHDHMVLARTHLLFLVDYLTTFF